MAGILDERLLKKRKELEERDLQIDKIKDPNLKAIIEDLYQKIEAALRAANRDRKLV
jgi:hypothetical protein